MGKHFHLGARATRQGAQTGSGAGRSSGLGTRPGNGARARLSTPAAWRLVVLFCIVFWGAVIALLIA